MPVWDVEQRPARERLAYWHEVVCQAFVPLTPRRLGSPTEPLTGRVEARPLGPVNRAGLRSAPQTVAHGPREVGRGGEGCLFVNLQLDGECRVRTAGRDSVVTPGRFTVVDTTEPYWFVFADRWRMLSYRLPRTALHVPRAALGVPVDATGGLGGVVGAVMHALWDLPEEPPGAAVPVNAGAAVPVNAGAAVPVNAGAAVPVNAGPPGAGSGGPGGAGSVGFLLAESFASVLAAALSDPAGPAPAEVPAAAARAAVLRHVGTHLGDPGLSVGSVCRRFGFSPRHLHALFADQPESFAATVRGLRLDRCARLIAAPGRAETITAIAARHGFTDPTTFGRAFRRRFGVAPRDYPGPAAGSGDYPSQVADGS